MMLKRVYDHSTGSPVLDHVKVLRSGALQNFSTRFVEQGMADGLLTLSGDRLVLHTKPELGYQVLRRPGYYCCHCNAPLDDAANAKAHLDKEHNGKASPDPGNPAGYRRDNFYACKRVN